MALKSLGRSDLLVSPICLGTMTFGRQNTEAEAHAQLDLALARDINFLDAAEMYPVPSTPEREGLTETIIGNWLVRQARERIVVATKATGPGRMNWIRDGQLNFTLPNLTRAVDNSLRRLQTDYIDLYQLHWPDRNVPIFGAYEFKPSQERDYTPLLETAEAMGALIKSGKIRNWGLSNETPWGLMKFLELADRHGLPRPVTVQNAYNLLNRNWENGMSEITLREGIPLLPYSVLGFGFLTAKYLDNPAAVGRATLFEGFAQRYGKPQVGKAVASYAALARRRGLTPAQMAIAFVFSRWFVDSTIIAATRVEDLAGNIDACSMVLEEDLLAEIEAIHLESMNPAP